MKTILRYWQETILLLILGILLSFIFFQASTANQEQAQLSQHEFVYLVPEGLTAGEDIPGGATALEAEGVTLFTEPEIYIQYIQEHKPRVVILHEKSLEGNLNRELIRLWYQNGITIAVINLKLSELSVLVNDPEIISDMVLNESWYQETYYSYSGRELDPLGQGGVAISGTNNINDEDESVQAFIGTLTTMVANFP